MKRKTRNLKRQEKVLATGRNLKKLYLALVLLITLTVSIGVVFSSHVNGKSVHKLKVVRKAANNQNPITDKLGINEYGQYFNLYQKPGDSGQNETDFEDRFNYDLAGIKQIPMKYIRLGVDLGENGPSNGNYDWTRLDYAVKKAQQAGLKVIIPVWFNENNLPADKQPTNADGTYNNDTYKHYLDQLNQLINALVDHFAGKNITYEAVNEAGSNDNAAWMNWNHKSSVEKPNADTSDFNQVKGDIEQVNSNFAHKVKDSNTSNNDNAKYLTGDFGLWDKDSTDNAASVEDNFLNTDNASGVSLHPYLTNKKFTSKPEDILNSQVAYDNKDSNSTDLLGANSYGTLLNKILDPVKNQGLPYAATEFAFGSNSNTNGTSDAEYDQATQANYTLRQIFMLDMLGFKQIIPFGGDDSDPTFAIEKNLGDQNAYPNGYQTGDDIKFNPVGTDLKNDFTSLEGYTLKDQESSGSPNDYLLRYQKSGQPDKLVYWTSADSHQVNFKDNNTNHDLYFSPTPQVTSENS